MVSIETQKRLFSKIELDFLRSNYPKFGPKKCAEVLNRSCNAIIIKSNRIGLKRVEDWKEGSLVPIKKLIDIDTAEGAYKLGLIWGDGTISKKKYAISITLVMDDFKDIRNLFEDWNVYENKQYKNWRRTCTASLGHKKLHRFLSEYDFKNKSNRSPNKILNLIKEELRFYFFRGWSDADGHISKRVIIAGSYNQDWTALVDFAENHSLKYAIRRSIDKATNYKSSHFSFPRKETKEFLKYIYKGKLFGLSRKYQTYKKLYEI